MDQAKLRAALPDLASLSDADAAARLSAPTYTPRVDRLDYDALASVWGLDRAASFRSALRAAAGTSAVAGYADAMLAGNGVDAGSPAAQRMVVALVTAKLLTAEEARAATNDTTYPADGMVTVADVATARAALARDTDLAARRKLAADRYNAVMAFLDAVGDGPVPSEADVLAMLGDTA